MNSAKYNAPLVSKRSISRGSVLNKPHHQIENDPRIWEHIAKLIDSELSLAKN